VLYKLDRIHESTIGKRLNLHEDFALCDVINITKVLIFFNSPMIRCVFSLIFHISSYKHTLICRAGDVSQ
jgi:hypothetical protein